MYTVTYTTTTHHTPAFTEVRERTTRPIADLRVALATAESLELRGDVDKVAVFDAEGRLVT